MATRRQILANRANAKLSTGPRTARGKQIVSRNALRHGLHSRAFVLESASGWQELLASMITEYKPYTTVEHALIQTMAIALVRQRHCVTLLTAIFDSEMACQDPESGNAPIRAAHALRNMVNSSQVISLLYRRQTAASRLFSRALDAFLKTRASCHQEKIAMTSCKEKIENKADSSQNSPEMLDSTQRKGAHHQGSQEHSRVALRFARVPEERKGCRGIFTRFRDPAAIRPPARRHRNRRQIRAARAAREP